MELCTDIMTIRQWMKLVYKRRIIELGQNMQRANKRVHENYSKNSEFRDQMYLLRKVAEKKFQHAIGHQLQDMRTSIDSSDPTQNHLRVLSLTNTEIGDGGPISPAPFSPVPISPAYSESPAFQFHRSIHILHCFFLFIFLLQIPLILMKKYQRTVPKSIKAQLPLHQNLQITHHIKQKDIQHI